MPLPHPRLRRLPSNPHSSLQESIGGIGIPTIQIVVILTDGTRIGTVMVIANETVTATATGIGIRDMTHTVVVVTGRLGTTSGDELQPDAATTDSCIVCIMRVSLGVYFNTSCPA